MEATQHIKVRKHGQRQWKFVGSNGSMTRLRIHALMFTGEQAQKFIAESRSMNPEYDFKIQAIAVKTNRSAL